MCLNTKRKYDKVTNTVIKWSIISKSVMIVIFVKFIDQLIDYPINRASLTYDVKRKSEQTRMVSIHIIKPTKPK